ncbi:MAG: hypothetical protein WAW17_16990 [Rhodococcus sp. (in: high G+C Gram-positive bacteria)]|uniref:hypothetical protein n=1 Tax=Rhodococcus sp. TaxID=1831 RepID=UPI003BB03B79
MFSLVSISGEQNRSENRRERALLLLAGCSDDNASIASTETVTVYETVTVQASAPPTTTRLQAPITTTVAPTPIGPRTSFSDGIFTVGVDIGPGTYVTDGKSQIGMCGAYFLPRKSAPDSEAMPGAQTFGTTAYLETSTANL